MVTRVTENWKSGLQRVTRVKKSIPGYKEYPRLQTCNPGYSEPSQMEENLKILEE